MHFIFLIHITFHHLGYPTCSLKVLFSYNKIIICTLNLRNQIKFVQRNLLIVSRHLTIESYCTYVYDELNGVSIQYYIEKKLYWYIGGSSPLFPYVVDIRVTTMSSISLNNRDINTTRLIKSVYKKARFFDKNK